MLLLQIHLAEHSFFHKFQFLLHSLCFPLNDSSFRSEFLCFEFISKRGKIVSTLLWILHTNIFILMLHFWVPSSTLKISMFKVFLIILVDMVNSLRSIVFFTIYGCSNWRFNSIRKLLSVRKLRIFIDSWTILTTLTWLERTWHASILLILLLLDWLSAWNNTMLRIHFSRGIISFSQPRRFRHIPE